MSTTRHLVNRQRRLVAAQEARDTRDVRGKEPPPGKPDRHAKDRRPTDRPTDRRKPESARPAPRARTGPLRLARLRVPLPAALALLAVLLGTFAAVAAARADGLRGGPAAENDALTDAARTSAVKGAVTEAVDGVFSYDHADPGENAEAARAHLTGRAVAQQREMLADVRAQGEKQKLVLTTTVTDSGVEMLDGARARVLVYADQLNTRTTDSGGTTSAAAMFAVDVVERDGTWKISNIDTFGRR